ncbi:DUF3332 family protein [Lentisphaera profundi]|uniref:DUF3332 family protein n=1 Tax=Lentisphaera profundi TaxID=1658616 RepID=A0ABY7VPP8_9BACT|nr:DUF3332 family protein [Lentisphaera profundi]WDE96141.1 DUF3332 family protein [Lentisphaera profundi]
MKKYLSLLALPLFLSSCMGTMGLTGKVKKFNLETTENRWGREGWFLGLNIFWVYRICGVLDLLIFNSIEFWSGENPINGNSPLVDIPMEKVKKMGFKEVDMAQVERINPTLAKLHINFPNGDHVTFDVIRDGNHYTVSLMGKQFFEGQVGQNMQPPHYAGVRK